MPDVSQPAPHLVRQVAESFGSDPERYDRTRPRYPQAMADRIIAVSRGPDLLDVGIGTGISARLFKAAGCRVLGVEVDARMAAFARQGGFEVEVAKFEDWDSAGRMFDTVIAGQTWHWIDPVAGAAKAATVLRRAGRLAVFWNVFQPPSDLAEAFAAVYRQVWPDAPFSRVMPGLTAYSTIFAKAAEGIQASGRFGEAERWQFDWEKSYTQEQWLEQVPTFGGHNLLPPDKLRELLKAIGSAVEAAGGSVTMRYCSVVVTAELRANS